MSIRVLELAGDTFARFQDSIRALEQGMTYPLGDDRFTIDHGQDYFAFFRRLGDLAYFVALDNNHVVAVCAAVMRRLPRFAGAVAENAWYVCDCQSRRKSIVYNRAPPQDYSDSVDPADQLGTPTRRMHCNGTRCAH